MFGLKTLRIRKIERSREKEEKQRQEEQEINERKRKKTEYEKDLQRLKEKALNYVLTISAEAYVDKVGKKLSDYDFRLISVRNEYNRNYEIHEEGLELMVRAGEKIGAEVIVDIRRSDDNYYCYMMGTALIPKKEPSTRGNSKCSD